MHPAAAAVQVQQLVAERPCRAQAPLLEHQLQLQAPRGEPQRIFLLEALHERFDLFQVALAQGQRNVPGQHERVTTCQAQPLSIS